MPAIYSKFDIKLKTSILDLDSFNRLKTVSELKNYSFDIGYKNSQLKSTNYFITITCNQSKYSDILSGVPYFELTDNYYKFELKAIAKLTLKQELIELLLNDEKPKVHFTSLRVYIPEYENFVKMDYQDHDNFEISISFHKSKPKI